MVVASDSNSAGKNTQAPLAAALATGDAAQLLHALEAHDDTRWLADRACRIGETLASLGLADALRPALVLYVCLDARLCQPAQLRGRFDDTDLRLAEELTRLGDFGFGEEWSVDDGLSAGQAEALRRMLLALVADVRLVLVKLADQLWRLHAARHADVDTRRRLGAETREIYAPLANRLGVWQLKWQLEDMAFRFLDPINYREIAGKLHARRSERESYISNFIATLSAALAEAGITADITGRPKHIYSIWKKMQRKRLRFEELFDIRALRILVDTLGECYAALGVVHSICTPIPGEFDDYIATPKDNGYRSLHTAVIGPERLAVEVQIRTHEMHTGAELGVAAHWRYKEGAGQNIAFDQKIARLRRLLEPEQPDEDSADFIDRFKSEIFEDRIFVFSPRGDVIELPAGATPLDFAYAVHTDVGHRCRGAKVSGRMVPLTHRLESGDRVEILTARNGRPSRDWLIPKLGYLASGRSRAKVRAWFKLQDKDQNQRDGRATVERELARIDMREFPVQRLAEAMGFEDIESLSQAVGAGDVTHGAVAAAVARESGKDRPITPSARRKPRPAATAPGGVMLRGVGDLMSHLAQCCRPVPPEPVRGYITVGRGLSVHRSDCTNLEALSRSHPERVVDVSWDLAAPQGQDYVVQVDVIAEDRQGLLRDISSLLADEKVSIQGTRSRSDSASARASIRLEIAVAGIEQLDRLLRRLEQVPSVISARRG
ncbi:MAG: bifunctional (p)ppGpp synthetase/guanosine-3',5'-bis(diphosphate) 3'-pyrophosphohydrolase [Gammaproteobacteria bacterium]|nr:bifunctional (p)ppGpp synthetase/guanosine-3',5'-bis(diphosphate) 3'-pyrophosphohydrolase [Gammaproteobacteria bacterium]